MSDIICAREVLNSKCKVPAESDGEPVEDFDDRDEADSEAKSAKPSQAGDEVKPGHLWGFLKLCICSSFNFLNQILTKNR